MSLSLIQNLPTKPVPILLRRPQAVAAGGKERFLDHTMSLSGKRAMPSDFTKSDASSVRRPPNG